MKNNHLKLIIGLLITLIILVVVGIGVLGKKASAPAPLENSSQAQTDQNSGKSNSSPQGSLGGNTVVAGEYEVENIFRPNLGTTYITWQESPTVNVTTKPFTCTEARGEMSRTTRRTISGGVYCVTVATEGAMSKTYEKYTYVTVIDGKSVALNFTIKSVSCSVYGGEPQYTACAAERYDPDALALSIFQSLSL